MVVLEIPREEVRELVEADLDRWGTALDAILNRFWEACRRHDADSAVGLYRGEVLCSYTRVVIARSKQTGKPKMWKPELRFYDDGLEEKRRFYDRIALRFFDKYAWSFEEE
ncbi:MAG: hypothetical protein D6739_10845 [Nitrospirae bacterium]|nr:MAG: hypothetical protein D6739_10845 [Nitrospirota bacterium]